jgi:nucleotide-binding universal stress UspA family protein
MSELTLTPENETKTKLRRRRTSPLPTDFVTEWTLEQTAGTAGTSPAAPVVLVVGFDGSEPAKRALDAAAELLRGREGRLEVVYVAQDPAASTSSERVDPSAPAADLQSRLAHEVRAQLDTTDPSWHFQRRDGAVAHELLDAAEELRRQRGPDATIALVVGGASGRHLHVAGSVPSNLAEVDRFPLVVVP